MNNRSTKRKNAFAWMLMVSAIAIHVIDESLTGFHAFYTEFVLSMREQLSFFPMPTFTYGTWLGGLIAAILILFSLTLFVYKGKRFIRIIAIVLGFIMIGNALGHILGSIYFERLLPGFWSSPLLLLTAVYVVVRGLRDNWKS
jgi:hypothetical protein